MRNEMMTVSERTVADWGSLFRAALMIDHASSRVPVHSYRDLIVWQQAMDLVQALYDATRTFPSEERYGLVSQIRRAAVSVASNIAEGHARSIGDYIRHLFVSSGSLTEIETQVILSHRLGFLPGDAMSSLLKSCDEIGRMLGALRKSLQSRRARLPKSLAPNP